MSNLRVLVVDDSAFNRRTLAKMLDDMRGVEVVGKAANGSQALAAVKELKPDLVTLDLEMPGMDGFTFLRLLMARSPLPVIVISGYSAKENVFRALEIGALDFVAKPTASVTTDLASIQKELELKVKLVRHLTPASLARSATETRRSRSLRPLFESVSPAKIVSAQSKKLTPKSQKRKSGDADDMKVVVIGASTGGPTALLELFEHLPENGNCAIVVAQHMPERFTRTFSERLDRAGPFRVLEASGGHELKPGEAWVCPGGRCVEVAKGTAFPVALVRDATPQDRYIPSVDRLFESAASSYGQRVIGVVLTGMGDDGAKGSQMICRSGGIVLAESSETAVIHGMPAAAARVGGVTESLGLPALAARLGVLVKPTDRAI